MRGLPEPTQGSSLPSLRLLQAGVTRDRVNRAVISKQRLPISPQILAHILDVWAIALGLASAHDLAMLRAAATICFLGFFRSGEITIPSAGAFDTRVHLAWGNVAANDTTLTSCVYVCIFNIQNVTSWERGLIVLWDAQNMVSAL